MTVHESLPRFHFGDSNRCLRSFDFRHRHDRFNSDFAVSVRVVPYRARMQAVAIMCSSFVSSSTPGLLLFLSIYIIFFFNAKVEYRSTCAIP